MWQETRFCVQPYVRRQGSLVAGEAVRFREQQPAFAAARRMRRRVAGVEVYSVTGWPVQDMWREPVLLVRLGETPAVLAA